MMNFSRRQKNSVIADLTRNLPMVILTCIPFLTSCSLGDRPQIATYTINANTPAAATQQTCHIKSNLQIVEPNVAPGLDSVRIAVMEGNEKINYYSGVKWASPLSEMLHGVLVDTFEKSGAFTSVSTENQTIHADMQLLTDIRNFEVADTATGDVHLRLVAKLVNSRDRKVLATIPYEKTVKPGANKIESIIKSFNAASIDAAKEILSSSLTNLPGCKPTSPVIPAKAGI